MNREEIWEILVDWNLWGNFTEKFRTREHYLKKTLNLVGGKEILVLKGIRRSGKSSLAYLAIEEMMNKNLTKRDTLIINLEDPRFPSKLDSTDLMDIYEVYLEKLNPAREHIVLLDEVQVVDRWEKFARFLIEAKKAKVIVTGSSSRLMSEEYATVLTGRHLDMEVFPLNFKEFLEWHNIKIKNDIEITKKRYEIQNQLEEYITYGGFPEVILSEKNRKNTLLRTYLNDIITKDIVKRFNIREIEKLENLVKNYITNISTLQSYNKLKEVVGLSLDSVERFSKHLKTARLFFFIPKFSYSIEQQILTPKKVYCIDTGFYSIAGFKFTKNTGRLMENLVAIELQRKQSTNPLSEIYYWKDHQQREVDFILKEGPQIRELIQVCYDVNDPGTKEREVKALAKASEELKCNNLGVITWDYESKEEFKSKEIRFIPLWKWLLKDH